MSIKFPCPHCQTALDVKDELAGKRGKCPKCKGVVHVPPKVERAELPPATTARARPTSPRTAAPAPMDVEEAAAAFLSDKPAEAAAPTGPTSIEFNCPMCDEPLSLSVDLGGKNSPCPACRRIIKVPLPKKLEPVDWRKPNAGLPSLARQDLPKIEGVWDNKDTAIVHRESLEEADALPELRTQLTLGQKIGRGLAIAAGVLLLLSGVVYVTARAREERRELSLERALSYLDSAEARKQIGPAGLSEARRLLGLHELQTRQPGCALRAEDHFHRALTFAREATGLERDLALTELAEAWVAVGGSGDEIDEDRHVAWEDKHRKDKKYGALRMLRLTLTEIRTPELRMEALRSVLRPLIARGQAAVAQGLALQSFNDRADSPRDRLEAVSLAGLELLSAKQQAEAERAAQYVQTEYAAPARPPLAASAVTLCLALGRPALKAGKDGLDPDFELVGQAEGQARLDNWQAARDLAARAPYPRLVLRARIALAGLALDAHPDDKTDLDAALQSARTLPANERRRARWQYWRLLQLGVRGGSDAEQLRSLIDTLDDKTLRSRGQLAIFRAQLASSPAPSSVGDAVEDGTISHALAHAALARDNSAAPTMIDSWTEPSRSFGTLGALLRK